MSSKKSHYIQNGFVVFIDTAALTAEINAIPKRRKGLDEMETKCRKATENVANAYAKAAARIMKGVPVVYCNMAGYVGILDDGSVSFFVKVPEMVPTLNINNISVDIFGNGTKSLLSFRGSIRNCDGKGNTPVPMLEDGKETSELFSYIRDLKDTKKLRFSSKTIEVPLLEEPDWKEQATEIQMVVNKHLLRAEREVREWLEELGQYADPEGLFSAML